MKSKCIAPLIVVACILVSTAWPAQPASRGNSPKPTSSNPVLGWKPIQDFEVKLDLNNPTNFSITPNSMTWFQRREDQKWCAVQGRVNTSILLPDGKTVNEVFYLVFIDCDEDGIYKVRAQTSERISLERATLRLNDEIPKWATDKWTTADTEKRRKIITDWLNDSSYEREMYEGFRTQRTGYEVSFSFCATRIHPEGPTCVYEFRLRDPRPDAQSECFVNLRLFEKAKLDWFGKHPDRTNAPPSIEELSNAYSWLRGRRCLKGGRYTLGGYDMLPTCTITNHVLPAPLHK